MRLIILSVACLLAATLRVCGSDEAPPPQPTSTVPSAATAPSAGVAATATISTPAEAKLGGTVVVMQDKQVEVLFMPTEVHAVVMDAQGAVVTQPAGLNLTATVQTLPAAQVAVEGAASTPATVALVWDPALVRFRGTLQGDIRVVSAPSDLTLVVNNQPRRAHIDAVAVLDAPMHGGAVVAVGPNAVEVSAKPDGEVEGYLTTNGVLVTELQAGWDLNARVQGVDGQLHPVDLVWDAPTHRFHGRVEGGVHVAPGPIELTLVAGTVNYRGRLERIAVLTPPSHRGTVVLAGDYAVEVVPPNPRGEIVAYAMGPSGAIDANANVSIVINGYVGARVVPVSLRWDPPRGCYFGTLEGGARFEPGTMDVILTANGRPFRGSVRAASRIRMRGPDLAIRGPNVEGAVGARVRVRTPGANVHVAAPNARVNVGGAVGGGVRVNVPPPPSVRVVVPPPPTVRVTVPPPPSVRVGVSGGAGAGTSGGAATTTKRTTVRSGGSVSGGASVGGGFSLGN